MNEVEMREDKKITQCASCGYALSGRFCSECGEKVLNEHDKKISHFFEEFIHILTHADSKFLKSLKYLFTRPGFLTSEYLSGRRKGYTSPLSLFLIANLIYFLVPVVDALNSTYKSQTESQVYSTSIAGDVKHKMQERKWTGKEMAEHYNAKSGKISKLLLVTLIFLYSFPIALLFYKRDTYYFDHVIFATEFVNFIILVLLLIIPWAIIGGALLIHKLTGTGFHFSISNNYTFVLAIIFIFLFLCAAANRVYKQPWYFMLPKVFLLTFGTFYVVLVYRYILFHITIWML